MVNVECIRGILAEKLSNISDGQSCIRITGASFVADEPSIFGEVNYDYVLREIAWYMSQNLHVDSIAGATPEIWKRVSSNSGMINSNYGFLLFSEENGSQFDKVIDHLASDKSTRRATAVYTRSSIHDDYNRDGMQDFICTNAVNYTVTDGKLNAIVQMRSNDVVFGYRNDFAWQDFILNLIVSTLHSRGVYVEKGGIIWQVADLHVYERHFNLVREWADSKKQ